MITQMKDKGLRYWTGWIKKRIRAGNPQSLNAKNIYILPSSFGWGYGLLLLTLFSGAINYQISSIFLMTFLLAIIGLISAWEAHANLKDLSMQLIAVADTQQGKPAQLTLLIHSQKKTRFGLEFQIAKQPTVRLEHVPAEGIEFTLPIATATRGCFPVPKIAISSLFPFGIFQVWGYACFDDSYYVYPQPIAPDFWPPPISLHPNQTIYSTGDDELYELKQVENPWAQPNLIAWKIAAKGQGWYLKTTKSTAGNYWLFRLSDLPGNDLETNLQHLSYWLHSAESMAYCYSLDLGTAPTPFSQGEEHLKHCLRQLALYQ